MATTVGADVRALAEELAASYFSKDPFDATYSGVAGYEARVPDLSAEAEARWRDYLVGVLGRSEALESSADAADGSLVLLRAARDLAIRSLASMDSRVEHYTVSTVPFYGPASALLIASRSRTDTVDKATDYLERCGGMARFMDQYTERMRVANAAGMWPVAPLVQNAIEQLDRHLAAPDANPLLAHEPPAGWDGAAAWHERLATVVADEIRPALGRYRQHLQDVLPMARRPEHAGLVYVPGGVTAYAGCVRNGTTLPLDPDDIHRTGLRALLETEERVAELGSRLWGTRTSGEAMQRLRAETVPGRLGDDDLLSAAQAAVCRAEEHLERMFHPPLPPPCVVTAMPDHMAESGMAPMYMPPTEDGSRPGTYLFNTALPGPMGGWMRECTAFHESVPGHHAQYARLRGMDLPSLLRDFHVVAHGEGWGLYAERLADELGLYSDDVQRLGMLTSELWRAVRLVVDTGMHARGWSRDRALRYAMEHTAMPEDMMRVEIDRYLAIPGQALGYLIGQREILGLRAHAQQRLGSSFDLRDFHSAVLDHGALPLPVLRDVVERYAATGRP